MKSIRVNRHSLTVAAVLGALAIGVSVVPAPAHDEEGAVVLRSTDADLAKLAWMAGSWARVEGERSTEEHWTAAAGGTMLGVNRTVAGGRTRAYEYLRIEKTADGIDYVASPSGQSTTRFRLIECENNRAVFENPEHDFPQRIIYERKGNELFAGIEGTQNGQPRSAKWSWLRATVVDQ